MHESSEHSVAGGGVGLGSVGSATSVGPVISVVQKTGSTAKSGSN